MTFRIKELSGSLIKSGRFKEAIDPFFDELDQAVICGVITVTEMNTLSRDFARVLLNPSDITLVNSVGQRMIHIAVRIPNFVPLANVEEVEKSDGES